VAGGIFDAEALQAKFTEIEEKETALERGAHLADRECES